MAAATVGARAAIGQPAATGCSPAGTGRSGYGSLCSWDGSLYDAQSLRARGLAGATLRGTVPGVPLSWFYA